MPLYAYKGVDGRGKPNAGVRDAESPKVLRQLMRKEGVVVTEISVTQGKGHKGAKGAAKGLSKDVSLGELWGGIKRTEIANFTRQMATLLRSGIPLAESLAALFDQVENVKFKHVIGEVRTAVNEGSALGDALRKHPKAFDELYCSMVRAGEVAGNLDEVLERLADFQESSLKLRGKVQGAMIYPVIMMIVGTVIMAILMVAVIPNITMIFEQQEKPMPLHTEALIWVSHMIGAYWYVWLGLIGLGGWLFYEWKKSENGKPVWHTFLLRMPLFGPLIRRVAVARFVRTLGTMLRSGVTMLRAIEISKATLGNVILESAIDDAREAIAQGESIAVTLRKSGHFPPLMTHMVAVGERAGQLETMLERVADTYDREVEMSLTKLTNMLEPLMLVFMGGAVAFVIFSILDPIMDMSSLGGM